MKQVLNIVGFLLEAEVSYITYVLCLIELQH